MTKLFLHIALIFIINSCLSTHLFAQKNSDNIEVYKNPIIHADYSDPDVVRVGNDFYMTASSFNCIPGLPILHSQNLVDWELISYALPKQPPFDVYDKPEHGNGVWAPCIRYHNNEYYIYYPDPNYGIYVVKAQNPKGPWSEPILVRSGKGYIDPSPLWDNNGKAYLVYAFAGSRATVKSVLMVTEMTTDGTKLYDNDVMVFDGHNEHPTVEGPKFYKRNGYYYIFAPAGGVTNGWQLALRSKNIYGPYESKIVLEQGNTKINGPHQGAWIDTPSGENWFIHFQDKDAYGRIVHMQPMKWKNDWPIIGVDYDGNSIGEPVEEYRKPSIKSENTISNIPDSDEFNLPQLGLQWQWHANYNTKYGYPSANSGYFRLNCMPRTEDFKNLWSVPNMLLQKFPSEEFSATTKLTFNSRDNNEEIGFVIMGEDYQYISLKQIDNKLFVCVVKCTNARKGNNEIEQFKTEVFDNTIFFKIEVEAEAKCSFYYSLNGKKFTKAGEIFNAKPGRWIGSKFGFFALRNGITNDSGTVDIDWIRISKK